MNKEIDRKISIKDKLFHIIDDHSFMTDDQALDTIEKVFNNNLLDYRMFDLINISNKYLGYYSSIDLDKLKPIPKKLTDEELIYYSRKVIEKIDHNLLEEFDSFVKSKNFKIYNKQLLSIRGFRESEQVSYKTKKFIKHKINIVRENSFSDVSSAVIHEFMHYTNSKNPAFNEFGYKYSKESKLRKKYTEFISIFFERYSVDVLRDEFNLPKRYFDYNFRIKNNMKSALKSILMYLPYLIYYDHHDLNYDLFCQTVYDRGLNINTSKNNYKICKDLFLKVSAKYIYELEEYDENRRNHPSLLNLDKKEEKLKEKMLLPIYFDNYMLSTILATRLGNSNKNDVLKLNSLLNDKIDDEFYDNPIIKKFDLLYDMSMIDDKVFELMDEEIKDLINTKTRGAL